MKNTNYQIIDQNQTKELAKFLSKEGQLLLPMLDLVQQAEAAVDEVVDVVGRATIEAILLLSAQQVAGPKHKGKEVSDIRWHGREKGVVSLSERKLRVAKPRLRRKGKGQALEVSVPAYNAMRVDSRLGQRMLSILMQGVSTRAYQGVLPQRAPFDSAQGGQRTQSVKYFFIFALRSFYIFCPKTKSAIRSGG